MNFIKKDASGRYREEEIFYQIGKIIFIPFCLFGFWFAKVGYVQYGKLLACAFLQKTGLPCPGCGGTRAFYFLLLGDIKNSLLFNPTVLYGVLAYFHFMLLYFYRKNITGTILVKRIRIEIYLYFAAAIILGQWIIKLLFFLLAK